MGIILPIDLPVDISDNHKLIGITLPITLPLSLLRQEDRVVITIPYKETINLEPKQNAKVVPYIETAFGQVSKIPYKEKAWFFPGLILGERVIERKSAQLTLNENVQALILVNFSLISSNQLKFEWYGNSVPAFTVMKKTSADTEYKADKKYSWGSGTGIIDIGTDSYNIYLLGDSNSGSSEIYTIGATDIDLVIPDVQIQINNKFYTLDIDYTSVYKIDIDY